MSTFKIHTGGSFAAKPMRVWKDSAWHRPRIKRWNGATWELITNVDNKTGDFTQGVSVGNLPAAEVEISGMARARRPENAGYLWVMVGGSAVRITPILASNASAGSARTTGSILTDVEDMASATVNGNHYLFMSDTGDNSSARATIRMVRINEPVISGNSGALSTEEYIVVTMEFPAGNVPSHKDTECILIDPSNGDAYFVTKRISPVKLYRLPFAASYTGTQTLEYMGDLTSDTAFNTISLVESGNNGYVVGGCIRDDGEEIILRSYNTLWRFARSSGQTILQALQQPPTPILGYVGGGKNQPHPGAEPQGESVCYSPNGDRIYTASELVTAAGSSASAYPLYAYDRLYYTPVAFTFRQGENSYTGAVDTFIESVNPDVVHGSDDSLRGDYNYSAYPTVSEYVYALLKWDVSAINANARVSSAWFEITVNNEGKGFSAHQVLRAWDGSSTWNSLGGLDFDGSDVVAEPFAKLYATVLDGDLGMLRANIPASLAQGWVDGSIPNHGIVLTGIPEDSTGDGMSWDSAEAITVTDRPRLVIAAESL